MEDKEIKIDTSKAKDQEKGEVKVEIDPLRLRKISLTNDFYTLCWTCLRKDIWKTKKNPNYCEDSDVDKYLWRAKVIGGQKISLTDKNVSDITIYMSCFIATVLYVMIGIMYQIFTTEIKASCSIQIKILRVLLVGLVEMNLLVEFRQGIVKLKYVYNNEAEFEPNLLLAKFISFCQILCVFVSFITLVFFICAETDPLELIQDFTGICVFTELDDWIGGQICSSEPMVPEELKEHYDFSSVNERMSVFMKMSMVQLDTDIVEDLHDNGSFLNKFAYFFYTHKYIIYAFPIIVIPIEWAYIMYHPLAI